MTLNNSFYEHPASTNNLEDTNVYVDDYITFKYPTDFLLNKAAHAKNYGLIKGTAYLNVAIIEKDKWQTHQHSYIYSFQMEEIDLKKNSVFLEKNVK